MPRTITVSTSVKKGLQFLIAKIEILGKNTKIEILKKKRKNVEKCKNSTLM
jgi:hypothetical protein